MTKKNAEEVQNIADQIEKGIEEKDSRDLEFTSYGSDIFDLIAGGGAPFSKMINLVGDSSSGKTFLACELIAQAKKKYGKNLVYVLDDAESGFSLNSNQLWGFDMVTPDMPRSSTVEEFALNMSRTIEKLRPGQKLIYVLDSFDNLSSVAEQQEFEEKIAAVEKEKKIAGSYGQGKSKMTNQFFRVMANEICDKEVLLVLISQIRENLSAGMFGSKYYRAGGKSIDFMAAQIFWINIAEKYIKKETPIGVCIQIKNTKSKTGKPFRHGFLDLYYDYGVDNTSSNIKYLYSLKTDLGKDIGKLTKMELDWDGIKYTFPDLINYIEQNELESELTRRVQKKWNDFEDEISHSAGRKSKF